MFNFQPGKKRLSIFEQSLAKDRANFEPLSPVSFLRRAAQVAPRGEEN